MTALVEAVFIGRPKAMNDRRGEWVSSIARDRARGPIRLTEEGFDGDKVAQPYHGGPEAACCVHLVDHYAFWSERYGVGLEHGHLGENLVLDKAQEAEISIGDIVRVGSALVQVSAPRIPCETQARRAGRADWVKLTIKENRTGFYVRVLEPGLVEEGDAWLLEQRLNERGSIHALNRCFYLEFDPKVAAEFAEMAGLADWWRKELRDKVARTSQHWSGQILGAEDPD